MASPRIIVVGGGLAGLAAVIKIAEAGGSVDLFSIVPVKRSHSVCAQGGINAAKNLKGEGDTTWKHFDDTVYGGDFPCQSDSSKGACARPLPQSWICSTAWVCHSIARPRACSISAALAGRCTIAPHSPAPPPGQQLLYALDEQVRRYEIRRQSPQVRRLGVSFGHHRLARAWRAASSPWTCVPWSYAAFAAEAIILATGGIGAIFGKSTNSVVCTGSAQSAVFQQGVYYANGEFIQVHPTTIPGEDKLRLMSESARGEGGRVWVPRALR
jgi:succinate dehydrogenase / fumarate reductase flavoprotein subunit